MTCQNCGAQNPNDITICQYCGSPLTQTEQTTNNTPTISNSDHSTPQTYYAPQQAEPQKKKKKKKGCLISLLIVVAIIVFGVIVFKALPDSKEDSRSDDSKIPVGAETNPSEDQPTEKENVTIEEQVIFDSHSIKVTVTGMDVNGLFGADIKLMIENNSNQNITVQADKCNVNDVMVYPMFSADVAAGKKANDSITLSSSDLETANITVIKDVEFVLHFIDPNSFETILDSDVIHIQTSADPSNVQKYDDSGYLAYNESGIKIVVKKLNSSNSFWGSDVYVFVENNSKNDITIQARNVSVNGFMVEPSFSCDVLSKKKAYDTITFFESDLEDNNINDISEIELSFHIFDMESWNTIKNTDPITITFETEQEISTSSSDASDPSPLSGFHLYDQARDIPVIDPNTSERKGTFTLIKSDSALITDELIIDWYENHVMKDGNGFSLIVFVDKDEKEGIYALSGMIAKNVHLESDPDDPYLYDVDFDDAVYYSVKDGKLVEQPFTITE
ncbi:MAG: zinc ribbon domain-containing protein [Clostridia bacterium]|nr:zinc ribbon domain-containing protein [Clostridia bacterium]